MNQCGSNQQKLPGNIEIELLHLINNLQILLGDFHNPDIVDIHFMAFDQMEKEIKGAGKIIQTDFDCHKNTLSADSQQHITG
jgi:hypothetical protein